MGVTKKRLTPLPRPQQGATLLEVLVAIVVLSFGVLGMVGLQAASLQANREARLQAHGVRLAAELAELMRANKAVAVKPNAAANPYLVEDFRGTLPTETSNCFDSACASGLELARSDMLNWLTRVKDELPGARVVVCFDATPYTSGGIPRWGSCSNSGGIVQIKIGWTRASSNRAATGTAAFDRVADSGSRPSVVTPVTAGNN